MGKNDRNRIQTGMRGMGRGFAPTMDDIEALRARQRQSDKGAQPEPKRPFASFLGEADASEGAEQPPKRHPAQGGGEPAPSEDTKQEPQDEPAAMAAPQGPGDLGRPEGKPAGESAKLAHVGRLLGAQLMGRLPVGQREAPGQARRAKYSRPQGPGPSDAPVGPEGRTKIRG